MHSQHPATPQQQRVQTAYRVASGSGEWGTMNKRDLVIIGGGAGGLVVASVASQLGLMSKFITHKGRILGATILGPHAGELIHEVVLAMKTGIRIGELSATIHAYPTLAQIHRRSVNTLYGKRLFSAGTRSLVRWVNRLIP